MKYLGFELVEPVGVETNFESFNSIQNRYDSRGYNPKSGPPQKLFHNVVKEFLDFCNSYHVDSSKYRTVEPCEIEGDWRQFDFICDENTKIAVHSLIYRDNTYEIVVRVIDLA